MTDDSLIIYQAETERINLTLKKLLKGSEAKCALLVDKDGHLVTRQGFTQSLDTTSLAALLAGSFASTREIAKLVGEPEFSVLFHQGKRDHIHMSLVGDRSILVVVFDDRTTIGMVRLYAKEASVDLEQIFADTLAKGSADSNGLTDEFTASAGDKLDDIFHD
ncbi:MAG: roadblock/LC7 domain-containing protein [candidate division Zixibacteria bacterium]|nr:roadblock/LC7 domain-containing protein [candidate division Zixibacteria bacterium]MBU1471702.1 roadblock/LC7 domain-containing protein [candidate division Zixibacteria bacterium]MBU2625402.1 roadblock/LC7 domain-containing protein [candidate division Zixibacteria bacterium]